MHAVKILEGPFDWQILQQENGFATAHLKCEIILNDEEIAKYNNVYAFCRVVDMASGSRVGTPAKAKITRGGEIVEFNLKIAAGGPYRIETYLRRGVSNECSGDRRANIGVGDIYLIAGQSNAVGNGRDLFCEESDNSLHLFRKNGKWAKAEHPIFESTDQVFGYPDSSGYSPWITFGKILSKRVGYPIGFIPAAVGGTHLMFWDRQQSNPHLFNNMLKMIEAAGVTDIKGILWYQGCNDAETHTGTEKYLEMFKRIYADFETIFHKNIPLLSVQLNKIVCYKDGDLDRLGKGLADIRDAQRRAANKIENVFIVPSIDLPVCDGIHNSGMSNSVIGQRLADLASKYIYNKNIICDAPQISEIKAEGNIVTLYFDNVYDGLFSDLNNTNTLLFSLYDGEDRLFPTDYKCEENKIILTFERDIKMGAYISCDRYNESGLIAYDLYSYLPFIPFNKEYVKF